MAIREPEFQDQRRLRFGVPAADAFEAGAALVVETGNKATFAPARVVNEPESTSEILTAVVDAARREAGAHRDSARAQINLGIALLQAGDAAGARGQLEAAVKMDPSDLLGRRFLARTLLILGFLDEADTAFATLLEEAPTDAEALVGRAEVAERQGRLDSALIHWGHAAQLRSDDPHLRLRHGLALLAAERPTQAVGELRRGTRIDPRSPSLYQTLGTALAITGDQHAAERAFRAALRLAPRSRDATLGLADVLITMNRGDEAQQLLRVLIDRQSTDRGAIELAAWGHIRGGQYRDARTLLIVALRLLQESGDEIPEDRARLLNNLGVATLRLGNPDDAMNQFRASIGLGPQKPIPYHNLLRLLFDHDQADEGERIAQVALKAFPDDPKCRLFYTSFLFLGAKYERAEAYLRGWIEEGDAPPDAWAELGYVLIEGMRQPADAVLVLEEACQRFPNAALVGNNLAYALLLLDRIPDARVALEAAVLSPTAADISEVFLGATWGLLRLREGDLDDAEQRYRAAARHAQTHGRTKLAETVIQKMHLEFAREFLRRSNTRDAIKHIRWGLERKTPTLYREELAELDKSVRVSRAVN
jgi:Tfp pilus assembly protein PilF